MTLTDKREKHLFHLECEQEAEKMMRKGVLPWRALEEARKIVETRRARLGAKSR